MNNKKLSKTPKLRFPSFKDEWEEKTIGKIGEVLGGGTPDTTVSDFWEGDITWLTPSEVKNKYVNDSLRKISEEGLKNSSAKLLPKGTVLMTSRATIAEPTVSNVSIATNQGFQSVILNKDNDNEFYYYWILNNKKEFIRKANGSTFLEISRNDVRKMRVSTPTLKEQKKIALFLSSVDSWIENLRSQKEALEKYKKGMMQKIFSQEIRFKEENGNDFPEWEVSNLNELTKIPISDGPHLTPKFLTTGIPFLSVDNLVNNKVDFSSLRYISLEDHLEFSKKCKPKLNDLLLGKAASVGSVAIVDFDIEFNIWSPIADIRLKKEYDARFFYFEFQTDFIKRQVKRKVNNSSQENLGMGDIKEIIFKYPTTIEQKKIAEFLISIDNLIESKQSQIEKAETWKKGLMQQLFI